MKLRQIEMFILGFIIFISETTLAMAISEQTSPVQEEQEYNTLEDIKNEIENISSRIILANYQEGDTVRLLELYNERGIKYFCIGLLENAFEDFNHVLNVLEKRQEIVEPLLALALWGRMLCYAYQDHEEEAIHDLNLFQSYFLSECSPCTDSQTFSENLPSLNSGSRKYKLEFQNVPIILGNLPPYRHINTHNENLNYSNYVHPVAQFADPNERLSIEQCKDRVKGTADIMRLLSAKIPNTSLVGLVNLAISRLEDAMKSCCYRER